MKFENFKRKEETPLTDLEIESVYNYVKKLLEIIGLEFSFDKKKFGRINNDPTDNYMYFSSIDPNIAKIDGSILKDICNKINNGKAYSSVNFCYGDVDSNSNCMIYLLNKFPSEDSDSVLKNKDGTRYTINPQTKEELFQILMKTMCNYFLNKGDSLSVKFKDNKDYIKNNSLKKFIITYLKCILDNISKTGLKYLNSIFTQRKDILELASKIQDFKELINLYNNIISNKDDDFSKMIDLGFGD
jgi:hypothetical protein